MSNDICAIAINRIHRKGSKPPIIPAKSAFMIDKESFDRLFKLHAVRRATADEIAAFEAETAKENGTAVLAAKAVVAKEPEKPAEPTKEEKAAAKAAAKEAAKLAAEEEAKKADEAAVAEAAAAAASKTDDDI